MRCNILDLKGWISRSLPLIYILLLAWLLVGALWSQPGLPNSADGVLHLHRSAAMARSWTSGVLWPRWFVEVYQGLGAPTFHYYSPLFYLLVAPLHLLGLPLDLAAKIVVLAFYAASGLAVWAWLRRLLSPTAGLAGAALYLSQPHLFREFYFQGDYPQLLALLWLPVVLWAFTRLYLDGGWLNWLMAPLSLALLVMTHNITAMLGAGALALYWFTLPLWGAVRGRWWRGVAAALLAAGASAFFWLPALADAGLVRIGNLQTGFFHYSQHFVRWQDLFAAPPLLDSRAANPPFPYMLGWAAWLAVAAAMVVLASLLRRTGRRAGQTGAVMGVTFTALCLVLTQSWSAPLWEWLPGLALVEFPWRLLALAALGVSLAGGAAVAAVGERRSWLSLVGLLVAVGLGSSVFLFPHQPFLSVTSYTEADTRSYESKSQQWGTTSGNEFLPRWADAPQRQAGELARERFLPAGAGWSWETPHRAVLVAADGSALPAGPLVLPVHYFPAWQAVIDGEPMPVEAGPGGMTALDLPGPAQQVVLQWWGTAWQRAGQGLSLLALLAWGLWLGWVARRGRREAAPPDVGPASPGRRYLAPLGLLLLLIASREAIQALDLNWFQRTSPPGAVSHAQQPLQVALGGDGQPAVTLLGWDLLSGSARPGSQVRLRLYWQAGSRLRQDLHSFLHLYEPGRQQGWAGVQNYNPGGVPTSGWIQALYYVDDLTLQLPLDVPPATYTLAVGMVDEEGERLAVRGRPADAEALVFLDEIQVRPLKAGWRQPLRPETATPAVLETLQLQGYDLLADPGGPVLRLYWEVLETPPENLVTFVHMVDEQGRMALQFDGPPLGGLLPTSQWPAGALLIDRRKLWLPDDLGSGPYRLLVGLYDPVTSRRLAIQPEADVTEHFSAEDALIVPFEALPTGP